MKTNVITAVALFLILAIVAGSVCMFGGYGPIFLGPIIAAYLSDSGHDRQPE